ncbi:uncharacterized protein H6S33_006536 [Morchella sextelata]|jgi:hypothetical protein|uniref:uncharacterized protein n=1 Tax=Morchella sextelata TaxID=1174677 RepID=UPI001D05517E|nr:uncharacterized protein H6S33_006536 [Morchella sextelata]KAH0604868.1 hypothetical protein H6S33_006536 [Morchella sextelata]
MPLLPKFPETHTIQPKAADDADFSTAKGLTSNPPPTIDDKASIAPFETANPGDVIISKSAASNKSLAISYKEAPVKLKLDIPINKPITFITSPTYSLGAPVGLKLESPVDNLVASATSPLRSPETSALISIHLPELDASIRAVRKCINYVFLHADIYLQEAPVTFFTELQLAVDAMGAEVQKIMIAIADPGTLETENQKLDAELLLNEVVMSYSSILEALVEYTGGIEEDTIISQSLDVKLVMREKNKILTKEYRKFLREDSSSDSEDYSDSDGAGNGGDRSEMAEVNWKDMGDEDNEQGIWRVTIGDE